MEADVRRLLDSYFSIVPRDLANIALTTTPANIPLVLCYETRILEMLVNGEMLGANAEIQTQTLKLQLQHLQLKELRALNPSSTEFVVLSRMWHGTETGPAQEFPQLRAIFRVQRHGERERIDWVSERLPVSERRLLWHGSPRGNFQSILSEGLGMIEDGIWFADVSSETIEYCSISLFDGHGLMLLCEVELGNFANPETPWCAQYIHWESSGPTSWVDAGTGHESLQGVKMVCSEFGNLF